MADDILSQGSSQGREESQLPPFLGVSRSLPKIYVWSMLSSFFFLPGTREKTRKKRPIIPKWGYPGMQTPDEEGLSSPSVPPPNFFHRPL